MTAADTTPKGKHPDLVERMEALVDCLQDADAQLHAAVPLLDYIPLPDDKRERRAINTLMRLVARTARDVEYLTLAADELAGAVAAALAPPDASPPEPRLPFEER